MIIGARLHGRIGGIELKRLIDEISDRGRDEGVMRGDTNLHGRLA